MAWNKRNGYSPNRRRSINVILLTKFCWFAVLRDLFFLAVLTRRSTEQSFELSFSVHVCFFLLSFIF